MRLHTRLSYAELNDCMRTAASEAPAVDLHILSQHGSRTHARAYEIALRGHGTRHTRRPNTGVTGANSDEYAATYDDWGWFLSAVFDADGDAKVGPYLGAAEFHAQTHDKFVQ